MRAPTARAVPPAGGGLLIGQWYLDVYFDEIDDLPAPSDDPEGFNAAVEALEAAAQAAVNEALARLRASLGSPRQRAQRPMRAEVQER